MKGTLPRLMKVSGLFVTVPLKSGAKEQRLPAEKSLAK